MKNIKVQTKLIIAFTLCGLLIITSLLLGCLTINKILELENPESYIRNYNIFAVVMWLLSTLVIVCVSRTVRKSLSKSLKQLSDAAVQIAAGNVNVDLTKHANDEFGVLIDEYQIVVDNIRGQAKIAEEVAEGNLTITITPKSGEDLLGNSLKKLVEKNAYAISNINDAAYQVMTSSSQVASASESLAQGSTEQASAIEEITASIGEIAQKTKKNATEASQAAELVTETITDVKKGNVQMQEMMSAMQDINNASESISKIIKTIDDIAFQTNILALNAAVEAARAGEAGKGFAVVAEEVRNLAAKSASAASETAELIEDSINKVEAGSKIADDTAKALEKITEVVQQSEALINGIAEASNYQATAVAQIDQAIGQVSQVVQTNSATSQECAAASEELSNQANRMRDLLSVYKVEHAVPSGMNKTQEYMENAAMGEENVNEQIISLGEGFGKY
ncbi:MAG: methyl-accepting chemotaxis protein [Clostridiales bacterium]|nr:methyl-accepting chemotaxis protein [Clostridiales bacterium]